MKYEVYINKSVYKDIRSFPKHYIIKIKSSILGLSFNPRPSNSKKLSGSDNTYRLRVGNYRIIYEIEDKIKVVSVVKVGHRKEVYRR